MPQEDKSMETNGGYTALYDDVRKQAVKENAIRMAQHHREHCDGKGCNISLDLLRSALVMAGITLTEAESRIFM